MKIVLCLVFVLIAYASASAIPDYDGPTYDLDPTEEPKMDIMEPRNEMVVRPRVRRFSCDMLRFRMQSFGDNDEACAVKCMYKGRRGGSCKNGQCICRY